MEGQGLLAGHQNTSPPSLAGRSLRRVHRPMGRPRPAPGPWRRLDRPTWVAPFLCAPSSDPAVGWGGGNGGRIRRSHPLSGLEGPRLSPHAPPGANGTRDRRAKRPRRPSPSDKADFPPDAGKQGCPRVAKVLLSTTIFRG